MDKFKILIVDDEAQGADVIRNYIELYFADNMQLQIDEDSMAKKAIERILKSDSVYDFIFTDLNFDSVEDKDIKGNHLSGIDIIIAAHQKSNFCQTIYFTVSGKKGSSEIADLEEILNERGIPFCSLLKDEKNEKVLKLIDLQLKKWTECYICKGITSAQKNAFFNLIDNGNLNGTIKTFNRDRILKTILIYWTNKKKSITKDEILKEFSSSFFDIPNIGNEKLYKNVGLSKIKEPLICYYEHFYLYHFEDLDELKKKAEEYLNELVEMYNLLKMKSDDSLANISPSFSDKFKALHSKFRKERLNIQGQLENPKEEVVMIQFKKRLWFRLFCLGAYFIGLSELDIYRFLSTSYSQERGTATEDNFKVFSRSLWLDNFSQKMTIWERNYDAIWISLTEYERSFLKKWYNDIEKLSSSVLENLFEVRELHKIISRYLK